jgi:hypothetical protein
MGVVLLKKSIAVICGILIILTCTSMTMKPLSWAYGFVQYKNTIYIMSDEKVTQIGAQISTVKHRLNYESDAVHNGSSNFLKAGTKLYQIKGIKTTVAIAAKISKNQYDKLVNRQKTEFKE